MYSSSIYPVKINRYQQSQNKPVQNSTDEQGQNSATKQEQQERSYNTIYKPTPGYYGNKTFNQYTMRSQTANVQPQTQPRQNFSQNTQPQTVANNQNRLVMTRQSFPNGEKTAIDYTQSKINISQVIKDFKNTTEAIGSPDDIRDTVYTYVSLVQKEAEKETPNKKIIQSNLKNASQVLDEYITATLKKPSKVVEGWIDSLFLQNVDYKYDESVINPDYLVKLPDNKNKKIQTNKSNSTNKSGVDVNDPAENNVSVVNKKDENAVKNPFFMALINAKKEVNPAEALNLYSEIINNAKVEGDSKSLSIAYFESGKLYDSFNSFEKAVENYESAIDNSQDDGLKAQAYMKMAQIQYDSAKLKDAGENYFTSIGYFGQLENPKAQAVLLSQTGKLASEEFDSQKAKDFFYVASVLADDIDDKKVTAKINQKAGEAFAYLNEPRSALNYYKESAKAYDEIQNNTELAKDYQAAAQLMLDLGNSAKARTLLNKAFKAGVKTNNQDLVQKIQSKIEALSA